MGKLPLSEMRTQILELCQQEITDEQFARELVGADFFKELLETGSCDSKQAAEILGYKSKRSVESMSQKSPHFPIPLSRGTLWSIYKIQQYMNTHGRRKD
ncbi:hypothetical protein [Rothia nasimurium]|uniref:hypothetical protein n=1 Tax=Rothia nasimurium TaxID=85336 RepID=UPI001626EA89|nr:hypothetical protein [Rothia nasimurium]